jgi:hypothetical protein
MSRCPSYDAGTQQVVFERRLVRMVLLSLVVERVRFLVRGRMEEVEAINNTDDSEFSENVGEPSMKLTDYCEI